MTEPNGAPPGDELAPTINDANGGTKARDQDMEDHKPRDSKGWDGKLRVDKLALSEEPRDPNVEIQSEPEDSEDEGPPPEQLPADEDLLDDTPEDEDDIELVHLKISDMASLRLDRFKQMRVLNHLALRQADILTVCAAVVSSPEPNRNHRHTHHGRSNPHRR